MGDRRRPAAQVTWAMPEALLHEWTALTACLGEPHRLRAGEALFRREEPSEAFFLLEEGLAKASAITAAGAERLVEIMGPGCLFGEGTALESGRRLVTVEAVSPLRLRRYRAAAMRAAIELDGRIGLCLVRILAAKQRSLAHRLIDVSALPARDRLLDLLGRLPGMSGPATGRLPLTHEEIASYLGLSRITVTRTLASLARGASRPGCRGGEGRPPRRDLPLP